MTHTEKIIAWMCRNPQKEWWYGPDFMRPEMPTEFFVGYEASASISALTVKKDPDGQVRRTNEVMLETKRDGKYRYVRFRYENLIYIKATVHPRLWELIEYYTRIGQGRRIQK